MVRIVVVDDDSDVRQLIALKLQRCGHQVADASDGRSGLKLCLREQPDVLVLDLQMPIMSGLEMLETLRTSPWYAELRALPVLILSARTLGHERDQALAMGADAFVNKPFSPRHLVEVVEQLASRSKVGA